MSLEGVRLFVLLHLEEKLYQKMGAIMSLIWENNEMFNFIPFFRSAGNKKKCSFEAKEIIKEKEERKTIHKLQILDKLPPDSSVWMDAMVELLMSAFYDEKPLFQNDTERLEAAEILIKNLKRFEELFKDMYEEECNSEIDREYCQICRSGLQYLVDEFKDDPTIYETLNEVLSSEAVLEIEEYIEILYDDLLNNDLESVLRKIPASHKWWFNIYGSKERYLQHMEEIDIRKYPGIY